MENTFKRRSLRIRSILNINARESSSEDCESSCIESVGTSPSGAGIVICSGPVIVGCIMDLHFNLMIGFIFLSTMFRKGETPS